MGLWSRTANERPGTTPVLAVELEEELQEAVTELQKIKHGIRRKEMLRHAGDIDFKNKTKVLKCNVPSKRWFKSFMMSQNFFLSQEA